MKKLLIIFFTLFCVMVLNAQVGVYKSTGYGAITKQRVYKEKFIGINAGIGTSFTKYSISLDGNVGVDLAFCLTKKNNFAIGAFASYQTKKSYFLGPLFVFGKFGEVNAYIFGAGFFRNLHSSRNSVYDVEGVEIIRNFEKVNGMMFRFGYKFSKSLYAMLNVGFGTNNVTDYIPTTRQTYKDEVTPIYLSMNIGYKFNTHKRNKTNVK